jgi:hypothetical protein
MIHRMGNGDGDGAGLDPTILALVGVGAAAFILYRAYAKSHEGERANPFLEVKEPSFPDVNSVAVRFGQIRELWSMGYIDSADAIAQADQLATALLKLQMDGKAAGVTVENLTARIDRFVKDVSEYQAQAA